MIDTLKLLAKIFIIALLLFIFPIIVMLDIVIFFLKILWAFIMLIVNAIRKKDDEKHRFKEAEADFLNVLKNYFSALFGLF